MRFYVLINSIHRPSDAITDFSPVEPHKIGDAPQCPACGTLIGMLPLLPRTKVELEVLGRRFGDVAFGPGNELLVSKHFRDNYLQAGLIGLSTFTRVEVETVRFRSRMFTGHVPFYFATVPVRGRAAIDTQASGIVYEEEPWTCQECRSGLILRLARLAIEPGTWAGEDIFFARGLPGTVVTSQRFKDFCDAHHFANCILLDADRYSLDFS
jgi:hypothetical protein